jgi:hypothetical protein
VVWDPPVILVGGLPLHPLVAHAVVVLVPLAALGALACAVRPAWRDRLGVPTLLVALAGTASVPVAVLSGQQLQVALNGGSDLTRIHVERGSILLPYAIGFLVLVAAMVVADRRARVGVPAGGHAAPAPPSRLPVVLAVLAALAGLVVTGLVVWIGHAGSAAVWSGVVGG